MPLKPDGDNTWQDVPQDLTGISYKELGDRAAYMSGWLTYAETRLAEASDKVKTATTALKEREAQLLKTMEKADTRDKWKFDRLIHADKTWKARKFNLDVAEATKAMMATMVRRFDNNYGTLSREMTRRGKTFYQAE